MLRKTTSFLIALTFAVSGFSQEVWSLEKCINHAKENNLFLKQSEIAIQDAELLAERSRKAKMPSLNASSSLGFQYGRNIDPTTNQFVNTRLGFNNIRLNGDVDVYTGGRLNNSIKQSDYNLEASREDAKDQFQNIALQMASAYLNILLAKEQVTIAQKALEQTNQQLNTIDKRIDAGTVPIADRLDLVAQIARNEQTLIAAQNSVEINNLTLKNLLELEPDYDLVIDIPERFMEINSTTDALSLTSLYGQALAFQPAIKAGEARIKSAELGIDIAKSALLPSVSAFAGIDTRYSNISNLPAPLKNASYGTQLDQNLGQNFGLSLFVPIYNKHTTKISMERAKLGVINSQLQYEQTKQQLKADVQSAMSNARANRLELAAAEKTAEAASVANENATKRYNLGAINTLELTTAKTNLDTAELNVVRAKYNYIFSLKIIDFYLGKELKLN